MLLPAIAYNSQLYACIIPGMVQLLAIPAVPITPHLIFSLFYASLMYDNFILALLETLSYKKMYLYPYYSGTEIYFFKSAVFHIWGILCAVHNAPYPTSSFGYSSNPGTFSLHVSDTPSPFPHIDMDRFTLTIPIPSKALHFLSQMAWQRMFL